MIASIQVNLRAPDQRGAGAVVALATILALVVVVPAGAQDPGVVVDPESPAAKEYAIPLEQARRDSASGVADTTPVGGTAASAARLFGVGVEAPKTSPSGEPSDTRGGGKGDSQTSETGAGGRRNAPTVTLPAAAQPSVDPAPSLWMGAIALVVLLLGAGAALALRPRR